MLESKDKITLVGIFLTFCVGLAGLIVGIRNSRKTLFINSITAHRARIIDSLRNNISEFSALVLHFDKLSGEKEKQEVRKRIDELRFLIKVQLDPKDKYDVAFIDLITRIASFIDTKNNNQHKYFDELHGRTQDLIKLEWQGIKAEADKGHLSKKKKQELRDKILREWPTLE